MATCKGNFFLLCALVVTAGLPKGGAFSLGRGPASASGKVPDTQALQVKTTPSTTEATCAILTTAETEAAAAYETAYSAYTAATHALEVAQIKADLMRESYTEVYDYTAGITPSPTVTLAPVTHTPTTAEPTVTPTLEPTSATLTPTLSPTHVPSLSPSLNPTTASAVPTLPPTVNPTLSPTLVPTDAYGVGEELQEEEQLADIFKSLLPEGPTKTTNDVEVKSKNKWGGSSHRHHRHHRHTPTPSREGDGCSDANPCPQNCNAITDLGYSQKGMSDADIGKLYFPLDNATSQSTHSAVWYNLKGCKYIPKTRSENLFPIRWNVDDYVACLANKGQSYGKKCTPQMLKDGDECLMEHPYPEYKDGLFKDFWCRREPAKMKDVQCPCHSNNIKSYIDNQLTQTFEVGWAAEVEMYKRRKAKRDSFRCKEGEDGDCHKPGGPSCGRSMQCRAGGFSFSPERLEQVKRQMLLNMENCVKNNCPTNDLSIDNLLDVDASFGGGSNC